AGTLLFDTRGGILILARLTLALLALALLLRPGRMAAWGGWLAGAAALLAVSFSSHAAARPEAALPILADWLHLLGAAHWAGGLAAFLLALGGLPGERRAAAAALLPRFSVVAIASVAVLAGTGLYSAVLWVGTLEGLTSAPYGLTLAVKSLLVLPLLALGALNLLWVRPRLAHSEHILA